MPNYFFNILFEKMRVNPSKLVIKLQWLLSVATRGPNSGPAPLQLPPYGCKPTINMLRETFWHHLQISNKDVPLPRDHSKRWKTTLPSLMRKHNCFRWFQTPLISGLSKNEVKKITMKFVKIPYCFHAFFEGATPHLHFHLSSGQGMTGQSSAIRQEEDRKV